MNKSVNELNLKEKTLEVIGSREVDEYHLVYLGTPFEEEGTQIYNGKGDIDWDIIPEEYLEYYAGYGTQY